MVRAGIVMGALVSASACNFNTDGVGPGTPFSPSSSDESGNTAGEATGTEPTAGGPGDGMSSSDAETTGGVTTTGADSSSSGSAESTTGPPPPAGPYGPCDEQLECPGQSTCLVWRQWHVCMPGCSMGSTMDCPPVPPGGESGLLCIDLGFDLDSSCLIDCTGDTACPTGMQCVPLGFPDGPFFRCVWQ